MSPSPWRAHRCRCRCLSSGRPSEFASLGGRPSRAHGRGHHATRPHPLQHGRTRPPRRSTSRHTTWTFAWSATTASTAAAALKRGLLAHGVACRTNQQTITTCPVWTRSWRTKLRHPQHCSSLGVPAHCVLERENARLVLRRLPEAGEEGHGSRPVIARQRVFSAAVGEPATLRLQDHSASELPFDTYVRHLVTLETSMQRLVRAPVCRLFCAIWSLLCKCRLLCLCYRAFLRSSLLGRCGLHSGPSATFAGSGRIFRDGPAACLPR